LPGLLQLFGIKVTFQDQVFDVLSVQDFFRRVVMQDERLVERVDPSELGTVARVLAEAYTEDPIHIWAMPKAATRLEDATLFFTLFLRWMRPYSWDVLATVDRSAVLVSWLVRQGKSGYPAGVRYLPKLLRAKSPVNDYFQWIDTFRPKVDHRYLEFIGCLPAHHSKGKGSLLLGSLLAEADREGLPVWAYSSNPRNLTFYRRLGFEPGTELRRDADTPPVTPLWRMPAPLKP
jgi:GNAT superfamily N-acetyltransferase